VDDHRLFRDGLRVLLEQHGHEVVGHAAMAREALRVTEDVSPDLVVLDLGLPGEPGLDVIGELISAAPVLVMTGSVEPQDVVSALAAGASGFLVKDEPMEEMLRAVETVAAGGVAVSPAALPALVAHVRAPAREAAEPEHERFDGTERDLEVLRLVAAGSDNAEIAERLSVSVGTVKAQISVLLERLGVENRVQLAVEGVRRGLV
jgi:DNA-binding NarL/FixJ family response regulator